MEFFIYKLTCYVCWKSFLIPDTSKSKNEVQIFINYKNREFRFYNLQGNEEINYVLLKKFHSNSELQVKNDNTRGQTYLKEVGKLSEGNFEPVFSSIKCPRCNLKFQSFPKKTLDKVVLDELSFKQILK